MSPEKLISGISPVSWLLLKSNNCRLDNCLIDLGMVEPRLLPWRSKILSDVKLPSSEGMRPT